MSEAIELGYYLPGEAEGAYPNGSRIVKVRKEAGDLTRVGTGGEVISSHKVDGEEGVTYFYFVKWDNFEHPVGVVDYKIGAA